MTMNGGVDEDEVIDHFARSRAESAVNHALAVHEAVGGLSREVSDFRRVVMGSIENLSGKVDAAITDMRSMGAKLNSMRPKVDSFHDLDERVATVEEWKARTRRSEAHNRKLRRRLLWAIILGAAGTIGAGLGAKGLSKLGVPVPVEHEAR